ncbi:MAG: baseplate J/gp47 family protein, partial [Oscillospiraceae bacterium]
MSEYESILSKMEQEYMAKSGCMPDEASDIGIRLKVLANELAGLSQRIDEIKEQTFPQTACGEFLNLHAKQKGLSRKKGAAAQGNIVFMRDTVATSDIVIPVGTVVMAGGESTIEFETMEEKTLVTGQTFVKCRGICKE